MEKVWEPIGNSGWQVRVTDGHEEFERLSDDEKCGAVVFEHNGGTGIVHLNLYEKGHSLKKIPLTKNPLIRWLIKVGAWTPSYAEWRWASTYGAAGVTSGEGSRDLAIKAAKASIDEMKARRPATKSQPL